MKVTVEQLPQRQVILNIEAEADEIEHSRKEAYQHLVQRARVPGFRQGKAPMAMVERWAGKAAFMQEAMQHLVPEVTEKALEKQGIKAARTPEVELITMEPLVWKATVDLPPEIDLGNYKEIRLMRDPIIVEPAEVDQALEEVRVALALWEPVDRPAQMGDLLTLDVDIESNGDVLADDRGVQFQMVAENTRPFPGFTEQLVGVQRGEVKEFDLSFPADSEHKEFAGKDFHCKIAVSEVKAKNLAPLDDEFAKGVGDGFDTLAALREHLEKDLRARKERDAKTAFQDRALQAVIDQARLTYSPGLVKEEAEGMLREQEDRLRRSRINMDEYLQTMGKSREDMIEETKPAAQQRLVRSLVATEIRNREQIEVADEEVEQELETITAGTEANEQGANFRRLFQSEAGRRSLRSSILTRKTMERLVDIVTQTDAGSAPQAGSAESKASESKAPESKASESKEGSPANA